MPDTMHVTVSPDVPEDSLTRIHEALADEFGDEYQHIDVTFQRGVVR